MCHQKVILWMIIKLMFTFQQFQHIAVPLRMQFRNFSLCIFANSRTQWFNQGRSHGGGGRWGKNLFNLLGFFEEKNPKHSKFSRSIQKKITPPPLEKFLAMSLRLIKCIQQNKHAVCAPQCHITCYFFSHFLPSLSFAFFSICSVCK